MAKRTNDSNPNRDQLNQQSRDRGMEISDRVAEETKVVTSNGNRESLSDDKPGSAEKGGPDIDKAQRRLPPDAER